MKQFTYIERQTLQINYPTLNTEEDFVIAIDNACAGVRNYSGSLITFVNQQGEQSIDFWGKLLEKKERYPLAAKYLQACIDRLKEYQYLYEDECFLGSRVAYKLAMTDKYFLPFYAELLSLWDMDHEVEELEWIEEIATHHGWCKGVEEIIIIRSTTGCGQYGTEQLCNFANFIRRHNEPLVESPFFVRLVEAIIKDYSRAGCPGYGENWNGVFKEEKELENIFGENAHEAVKISKLLAENKKTP